jgi:hypothetical protein
MDQTFNPVGGDLGALGGSLTAQNGKRHDFTEARRENRTGQAAGFLTRMVDRRAGPRRLPGVEFQTRQQFVDLAPGADPLDNLLP